MDAATRARLQAELSELLAKREKTSKSLDSALENAEAQTYSFGDSEGNQSVTRRDPAKLLNLLESLDRRIEALRSRLAGHGLHSMTLRRRV
jgi:hypothetical protein